MADPSSIFRFHPVMVICTGYIWPVLVAVNLLCPLVCLVEKPGNIKLDGILASYLRKL